MRHWRCGLSICFIGVLLAALPVLAQDAGSDARVEAFIRTEMERQHLPGLAVGIVKGKIVDGIAAILDPQLAKK
jgi:hypothetical protein